MFFLVRWNLVFFFGPGMLGGTGKTPECYHRFFDHLHYFPDFSASSEAIFKIPDATCRKIDALSFFGALIDKYLCQCRSSFRYHAGAKKTQDIKNSI